MLNRRLISPASTEQLMRLMQSRLVKLLEPSTHRRSERREEQLRTTLRELRGSSNSLYLFGGVLRDLMVESTPRDIDMVVSDEAADYLDEQVSRWYPRRNRYGGLNFKNEGWEFDLWPLGKTWAFHNNPTGECFTASFSTLPKTTFLNVEAIAVELWPSNPNGIRQVHEHGFFKAFRTRTVEINYECNPAPEYCIVRSLLIAQKLRFQLGPRLVGYIATHADTYTMQEYAHLQARHYGKSMLINDNMQRWLEAIQKHATSEKKTPFSLAIPCASRQLSLFENRQLSLWSSSTDEYYYR